MVSIILSTYNSAKYVGETIQSVLSQDYQNFELLIQDDCSTDDTMTIISGFLSDQRIAVEKNKINKGLPYNLNYLIKKSKGDIIVRIDADDIMAPNRLGRLASEFEKYPEVLLIGSDCIEIDEHGNELFYKKMPTTKLEIKKTIFLRNPFVHPSVAFKKSFFDIVGLYNESYRKFQDLELWARAIVADIEMKNINEPLIYFRISTETKNKRSSWHAIRNEMMVSWYLVKSFKAYHLIHKAIVAKLGLRLIQKYLPNMVTNLLYNKLR